MLLISNGFWPVILRHPENGWGSASRAGSPVLVDGAVGRSDSQVNSRLVDPNPVSCQSLDWRSLDVLRYRPPGAQPLFRQEILRRRISPVCVTLCEVAWGHPGRSGNSTNTETGTRGTYGSRCVCIWLWFAHRKGVADSHESRGCRCPAGSNYWLSAWLVSPVRQ